MIKLYSLYLKLFRLLVRNDFYAKLTARKGWIRQVNSGGMKWNTQIFDMRKAATSIRELLAQRYLTTILKLYLCIQNLSDKNCRCAI